jgi:hypothetical protein
VVAADPSGQFYHGTFVNGRRTADWTEGAPRIRRGELVEAASPAEGPSRSKDEAAAKPTAAAQEKRQQPSVETTPPTAPVSRGKAPASEGAAPVSDSLRSLTLPPASLRTETAAAPLGASPATRSSPPTIEAGLNAVEVIELADAEARARGYNLDQYQRPQVQSSTDGDTWSALYEPKTGTSQRFTVTIDREKKAEIKK